MMQLVTIIESTIYMIVNVFLQLVADNLKIWWLFHLRSNPQKCHFLLWCALGNCATRATVESEVVDVPWIGMLHT